MQFCEGRILQEEKLPSTRFQADYLQVSRSTVELAYAQLLSEGYIRSEPYRDISPVMSKISSLEVTESRKETSFCRATVPDIQLCKRKTRKL
ncbi:MAG: hypothetical protein V8R80_11505 [Eubacterium sp.]